MERSCHAMHERSVPPVVAAPRRWQWVGKKKRCFPASWQGHSVRRAIFLEEQERMEKSKEARFVFLVEEGRRAEVENDFPHVETQDEAEDRRAEEARHEAEARRSHNFS